MAVCFKRRMLEDQFVDRALCAVLQPGLERELPALRAGRGSENSTFVVVRARVRDCQLLSLPVRYAFGLKERAAFVRRDFVVQLCDALSLARDLALEFSHGSLRGLSGGLRFARSRFGGSLALPQRREGRVTLASLAPSTPRVHAHNRDGYHAHCAQGGQPHPPPR